MVIVIMVMTVALLIGAAALAEALASRSHANLDARQRRALQAANAGLDAVLYHENELDLGSLDLTGGSGILGTLADCLVPNLGLGLNVGNLISTSVATAGNACPIGKTSANGSNVPFSTMIPVGNHDYYNAEFIPSATTPNQTSGIQFIGGKIVSIGVDDNGNTSDPQRYVYEKVQASLAPVDPFKTVEANHDLTFDIPSTALVGTTVFNGTAAAGHQVFFNLQNNLLLSAFVATNLLGSGSNILSTSTIDVGCQGNAGTNNAYTLENRNLLSLLFVPTATFNVANPQTCSSPYWFTRPTISINSSKLSCPTTCTSQGWGSAYNSTTNEIYNTNSSTTLTFAPGDYVFCNFETNGPINVTASATSAPVRIFVDSPSSSRCASSINHTGSLPTGFKASGGNFIATQGIGGLIGGVTSTLAPSQIQVYDVGNGTPDGTTVTTSGSVANAFFLYAPTSNVSVTSLVSFAGTVIGYDVAMNTILYTQDLGLNNFPLSNALGIFHVAQYEQCTEPSALLTGTAATDTSGC